MFRAERHALLRALRLKPLLPLRPLLPLLPFALLMLVASSAARAESKPLWELGLGAAAVRLPDYRGAEQSRNWLLPVPYFIYRGDFFKADREGARAVLLDSERIDLDLSVGASAPTSSKDNRARQGMPDLAPQLELGPKLEVRLAKGEGWALQWRTPVRAVFTLESKSRVLGWTAFPQLNIDWRVGGWDVGALAGPVMASRGVNGYFYDVKSAFATAERAAYRSPGGYAGWSAVAGVSRRYGDVWVGGFARADNVAGARFADSPLVKRNSNVAFGVAVSWVFAKSAATVDE